MAKTLIFIHGWASMPEIWQKQKEYFCKQYEVIFPDISQAKDITEAASVINASIKDKEDFILIGWSLGWLAVLELLVNFIYDVSPSQELKPRRLPKGLIAVNSTAKFCDNGYLGAGPVRNYCSTSLPKGVSNGAGPTETHLSKMIRDCKRNPQKVFDDFYKSILTDTGKNALTSVKFKNIQYDALVYGLYMLRDCDYRDFIKNIDVPTLIITGAKDVICLPQASEYIHKRIKTSELKVFDCGHLPFLVRCEEFNSTIEDFIKRINIGEIASPLRGPQ